MSSIFGYSREAIRVKVKKCEANIPPEFRKFSVDPQITSFEILQSILAKAFDLKGDFAISYRVYDVSGLETYMPLLSDYDLDAAFLKSYNLSLNAKSEPCLCLKVELKVAQECSEEWEVKQGIYFITQIKSTVSQETKPTPRLHGIINQVGKTLNLVQRAFNFGDDCNSLVQPPRPHLSDAEFRKFLDPVGQIVHAKELRSVIYFGGIDPSLRRVVWKHLLNVYPEGMTGRERMDYIKKKVSEYELMKDTWKKVIALGPVTGELAYTTGMVRKDVLRTDRHHPFYAGSDDNKNIAALFNILTTYALNHPKVSYCQGMSDLASPLLVTMDDEAHAYICFCALMKRLSTNFMIDGIAMTQKFTHLAEGLMYYDPEFYNYLKLHQADDLLFCYRWLLLEMKREFAFEDSLRMLEVLWSSLPADPPETELKLYDIKFQPPLPATPVSPLVKTPRESPYTKVCSLRRQNSSISLSNYSEKKGCVVKRQNHSLDETFSRRKNVILDVKLKHQSLDDAIFAKQKLWNSPLALQSIKKSPQSKDDNPKMSQNSLHSSEAEVRPRSVSPIEQKSDLIALLIKLNAQQSLNRSKSMNLSSSMTSLIKFSKKSDHLRELKDKITSSKLFSSLDRLDTSNASKETQNKGKIVKNLNEFLNFAPANTKTESDESKALDTPKILLTKPNFDHTDNLNPTEKSCVSNNCQQCPVSNDCSVSDDSSPDDSQEYFLLNTSITRELKLELENFDKRVFGEKFNDLTDSQKENKVPLRKSCNDHVEDNIDIELLSKRKSKSDDIYIWENPLHRASPNIVSETLPNCITSPDEQIELETDSKSPLFNHEVSSKETAIDVDDCLCKETVKSPVNCSEEEIEATELPSLTKFENEDIEDIPLTTCEEVTETSKTISILPPPNEFGGGNPFLMFLCITVLLQHRDTIMNKNMDYNEMAMHFDKMVRKHNVIKVLNQARQLYSRYIKQHTLAQPKNEANYQDC